MGRLQGPQRAKRLKERLKIRKKKKEEASNKRNITKASRYSKRLEALKKIKNPNDWQKNQIRHAEAMSKEYTSKVKVPVTKDHLGRDPDVGAKNRAKVRKNPASEETLNTVRKQVAKDKALELKKAEEAKNNKTANTNKTEVKTQEKTKSQYQIDKEKAAAKKAARDKAVKKYGDDTRNSPAARSGAFTDSERYDLAQKHKKWKADRAAGKLKKRKWDPRKGKNQRR